MTDQFSNPASFTGVDWNELNGGLILVDVLGEEIDMVTVHGVTNAIRANVAVLDGDLKGQTFDDILIFGKGLRPQLKPKIGGMVLGRVGQLPPSKPGAKGAWIITDSTEADKTLARAYLKAQPEIAAPF